MDQTERQTFSDLYNVTPSEYIDTPITPALFSVRVYNRFMANGVATVEDLLKLSPEQLMQIRGFGANCVKEVSDFCASLSSCECSSAVVGTNIIKEHRASIAKGDFSFAADVSSPDSCDAVAMYQAAFEVLGEELSETCVYNPENIAPIVDMLNEYYSGYKRYLEIKELVYTIPADRRKKRAIGYINAFTLDDEKRAVLRGLCGSEETSLESMAETHAADQDDVFALLKRFLKWCSFDLGKEIQELFEKLYASEKHCTVIRGRAVGQTLEKLGNILGVTRERIRQIETKAKKKFVWLHSRVRIVSKISAERNGDAVLTVEEIETYCGERTAELVYLLQNYPSTNYTYDKQLNVFLVGDDSLHDRAASFVERLPDIINVARVQDLLSAAQEEEDIPADLMKKVFDDAYKLTGDVYHRCRLSLATVYERVIQDYYPMGIKAYDPEEIRRFREIIAQEYGDVGLPQNDRAVSARIAGICILCGRGLYRLRQKEYMPQDLKKRIYTYIWENESSILPLSTVFNAFEDDLTALGIDNRYYLQGVLHELFEDNFFFKRDYVSKDENATSFYAEIVEFIKKSRYPVSKEKIKQAYPGITEIVITLAVDDPSILNYFGEYLHASKLFVTDEERNYLESVIAGIVADGKSHHGSVFYDVVMAQKPEIFTRNAANFAFSAFSILEYLFRKKYQFSRPYVALNGVEIGRPGERLHDMIYASEEFLVSDISEFMKENRFQVQSMLAYINQRNDQFLLTDANTLMKIDSIGITKEIAESVENILVQKLTETVPIFELTCWNEFPKLNVPWSEWLLYSVLHKWGTKVVSATSSNQMKLATPLVALAGHMDVDAYKDFEKTEETIIAIDDLSRIDELIEDIVGDDLWGG